METTLDSIVELLRKLSSKPDMRQKLEEKGVSVREVIDTSEAWFEEPPYLDGPKD